MYTYAVIYTVLLLIGWGFSNNKETSTVEVLLILPILGRVLGWW